MELLPLPNPTGTTVPAFVSNLRTTWENFKKLNLSFSGAYYTANYSSLATLVTRIGTASATIYVNSAVTLTANLTIPSTISLVRLQGGAIGGAFTLTINGTLTAGLYSVFVGGITVVGNNKITGVNPYWFGAVANKSNDDLTAIQSAILFAKTCDRVLYLPPGNYGISNTINLKTLLDISDAAVNQGFFTIRGDNPKTCRIIPIADIAGAMISCVNTGTGNAANARELRFENFSLYSDAQLNKSADHGFYLKWCAQVFYESVTVINAVNKRIIYHDTAFVCSFNNCNFVGKANELGDTGMGGAPDGPSNAMNFPPALWDDRLTGLYFANTCTTTTVQTCRVNSCRIGINLANGDAMGFQETAPESCLDVGAYLSGSTTNISFSGTTYWEGNAANILVSARADSLSIQGFFNGGTFGVKIVGAEINAGVITGCHFKSVDGIVLDAPVLHSLSVYENHFEVDTDDLVYAYDTYNTYGTYGHSFDWRDNYTTKIGAHERSFKNYNLIDFQDWDLSLTPTRTPSDKKFRIANVYDVTYPIQAGALYTEVVGISSGGNQDLRGSWITVFLPIKYTSVFSATAVVVASSSGGSILLTYATDFPAGATVTFSTTGTLPTGLTAGVSYNVDRISATTCKLSLNYDDTITHVNIAYTNAGSGTHTMTFKDTGGKLRISDGVNDKDFLIGGIANDVWAVRKAYVRLSASASTLTMRLYPNGANMAVENIVVMKGIHSEMAAISDYLQKQYIRPNFAGSKTPFRMYASPTANNVLVALDNPGSPPYGAVYVYDTGGDKAIELNGGTGDATLTLGNVVFGAAAKGLTYQAGPKDLAGTADPEATVTAAAGSTYRRTNGTLSIKASGAGNTGWVAVDDFTAKSLTAINLTLSGDLKINAVGKGLFVKEGANATMGTATLVAGSVVVSTTKVTATSRIQLTGNADGGTPGWLRVSARTPGTSFTITSSAGADTGAVAWVLVEPA